MQKSSRKKTEINWERGSSAPVAPPHPAHPLFLWGSVNFGDNIEDEWFITWMLLELTRSFPVSARIWDNDGEFVLIEAAYALPRWLKPERAVNRVWLHQGRVHVVPLPRAPEHPQEWSLEALTAPTAMAALTQKSEITSAAGKSIHDAVQSRISAYPERARELMHRSVAVLPARLAHVLCCDPQSVAAGVETFHYRDVYDAQTAQEMKYFPPENMVRVNVMFNRCLYAQIALQDYSPPKNWPPLPLPSHPDHSEMLLGVKLAAGYEMLLGKGASSSSDEGKSQNARAVLKILEEENGGGDGPSVDSSKLSNKTIFAADSVAWLHQAPEAMEEELRKREVEVEVQTDEKQQQSDFDPDQLSSRVQHFMEAAAGFEGAEIPADLAGNSVDFSEERFLAELEKAFGVLGGGGSSTTRRTSGGGDFALSTSEDDDDEGSSFYSQHFSSDDEEEDENEGVNEEATFTATADQKQQHQEQDQDHVWETATATDSDDVDDDEFRDSYDAVLAQQLADTSIAHTFISNTDPAASGGDEQEQDVDALRPVDVDANLVSSLLASYQEQGGLAGPASTLAGLLGIRLPDPS